MRLRSQRRFVPGPQHPPDGRGPLG
jgi:hypothetical protein